MPRAQSEPTCAPCDPRQIVAGLAAAYEGPVTQGKKTADRKRELTALQASETAVFAQRDTRYARANEGFVADHQQQQQQIRQHQDAVITMLGDATDRLGVMAKDINAELTVQANIIDEVDRDVGVAQSKMEHAMKGIKKLLGTKDTCHLATIGGLILALVVLTVVALT